MGVCILTFKCDKFKKGATQMKRGGGMNPAAPRPVEQYPHFLLHNFMIKP